MENKKWYIKKENGQMQGPYYSQESAEQVKLSEGINGFVVAGTDDGKQLLME